MPPVTDFNRIEQEVYPILEHMQVELSKRWFQVVDMWVINRPTKSQLMWIKMIPVWEKKEWIREE